MANLNKHVFVLERLAWEWRTAQCSQLLVAAVLDMGIILTVCILKKKLNTNCILRVVINGYLANTLFHFFRANWTYSFLEAMCNNSKKNRNSSLGFKTSIYVCLFLILTFSFPSPLCWNKYQDYCSALALQFLWSVVNGSKANLYAMSPKDRGRLESLAFRNLSFCLHHNTM